MPNSAENREEQVSGTWKPITVAIPNEGPLHITFTNIKELEEWTDRESKAWGWMPHQEWPSIAIVELIRTLEGRIEGVKRALAENDEKKFHEHSSEIRYQISQGFGNSDRLIYSQGPGGKLVAALGQQAGQDNSKKLNAIGIYYGLSQANLSPSGLQNGDICAGYIRGVLFKNGVDAALHEQTSKLLGEQIDRMSSLSSEEQTAQFERSKTFANELKNWEASLNAVKAEIGRTVSESKERLQKHEDFYDKKLSVSRPVAYWSSRYWWHIAGAIMTGIVALLSGGAIAYWVFYIAKSLLLDVPVGQTPSPWRLATLATFTFMLIWLQRLIVRVFLSNLHLATDASERRMMIQTYLALEKEGIEFTAEDKHLVLQHIFRSTADGIVKDDASSPGLIETLLRR